MLKAYTHTYLVPDPFGKRKVRIFLQIFFSYFSSKVLNVLFNDSWFANYKAKLPVTRYRCTLSLLQDHSRLMTFKVHLLLNPEYACEHFLHHDNIFDRLQVYLHILPYDVSNIWFVEVCFKFFSSFLSNFVISSEILSSFDFFTLKFWNLHC